MHSAQIRERFLTFFEERSHERVPSSSLVPRGDSTLLFTNAGMVQFKDVFLGLKQRAHNRAVSCQRCVRAGGKHNDLDNVGYTARHHTFFEMLGNFSFGDYFKEEAIRYAWEFLTNVLSIPEDRLWVSVYHKDEQAAQFWLRDVGIDARRLCRCNEEENFWSMGNTGPCGPCTEIYYDHGADLKGNPPGETYKGERYVEIWNLVFTQFNRTMEGKLETIPRTSVDTGMGLERICAVMQGVHDNYETDLFQPLIKAIHSLLERGADANRTGVRTIADHIRSSAFLIADGVIPSNEGRGYVLRRIIRRAVRHGSQLGMQEPFFHLLVDPLTRLMGSAYPHLLQSGARVHEVLLQEEERFRETLEQGLRHLEQALAAPTAGSIPGETVFRLYDTYGFPADLTADIARERGLKLDMQGFDHAMEQQRSRGRRASRFEVKDQLPDCAVETEFQGYQSLVGESEVGTLYHDGREATELQEGERGIVVLQHTPFYAESGGQIGDRGQLLAQGIHFQVADTLSHQSAYLHVGVLEQGRLRLGQPITARVDPEHRADVTRNHSATHLLNAALRLLLGAQVTQQGAHVSADRLRFDFAHSRPLSAAEIELIEERVNAAILDNVETQIRHMPLQQALHSGALSLDSEKYTDPVRVLDIGGDFSRELCGGTHVRRSGDIGLFKITSQSAIAAGVRRLEAITGRGALAWAAAVERSLQALSRLLGAQRSALEPQTRRLLKRNRDLENQLEELRQRLAHNVSDALSRSAQQIGGLKVIASELKEADPKILRQTAERLRDSLENAVLVLACVTDGKISLVAGVSHDTTGRIPASELVKFVAAQVGGRGGGQADLAQAGGNNPTALPAALASVAGWIQDRLAS